MSSTPPSSRIRAATSGIDFIASGRSVIDTEAQAVAELQNRLDEAFQAACRLILECRGRIVVVGMGKSGHIGGKIASTLASTGTPAFFVHPGEASHGDLGMITAEDRVIAISNSGETPEILTIIPILKRLGIKLILLTGRRESALGAEADTVLDVSVAMEACPLNLAPTASTTATLVMGDALAIAVLHARGFSQEDFARTHPGGMIGRRLLLYARDIMHTGGRVPLVGDDALVPDAVMEMTSKSLGMTGVIDAGGCLIGIFTDGDLRRVLNRGADFYRLPVAQVMTRNPFTIRGGVLAAEIVHMMREHARHGPHAINGVFVVDAQGRVEGALNTHDLLRAGVM